MRTAQQSNLRANTVVDLSGNTNATPSTVNILPLGGTNRSLYFINGDDAETIQVSFDEIGDWAEWITLEPGVEIQDMQAHIWNIAVKSTAASVPFYCYAEVVK
jgi:hypothetical protein